MLKVVVGSSTLMFIYIYILIHLSYIASRYFTEALGIMEDAPNCNTGVFRDLI